MARNNYLSTELYPYDNLVLTWKHKHKVFYDTDLSRNFAMHVVNQSEKQFKYIRELNDNDTMFGFGGSTLYTQALPFDINLNLNIGKRWHQALPLEIVMMNDILQTVQNRGWVELKRKDSMKNLGDAIGCLISNILCSFFVFNFSGYIWIPKQKQYYTKSRYNKFIKARAMIDVIDIFVMRGLLEKKPHISFVKKQQESINLFERYCSRYRATTKILKYFAKWQLGVRDIIFTGEPIQIKSLPRLKKGETRKLKEKLSEYKDTNEIVKMRNELNRYNELLRRNFIYIDDWELLNEPIQIDKSKPAGPQIKMLTNGYTHIHDEPKVVPHLEKGNKAYRINIHEHRIQHSKYVHNYYYRVFNRVSTKFGGRFYGHWITRNCPKHLRKHILINGKKTVELDYSGMNLCIAYSLLGMDQFKEMDMYNISGLDRADVKQFTTIALNSTSLKKACKSTIEELGLKENKANMDMFEYEIPLALSELHPMIYEKYFYRGKDTGAMFMRHESNIANQVIMKFVSKDIPILVLHDSFIVEEKHKDLLGRVMYAEFNKYWSGRSEYTGVRCKPCTPIVK